MNAVPSRWRRLAVKLAQHASWVLPGARSPWADAMRRELDYIADDPTAVRWALGCLLASYRARLTHRPSFSAGHAWRHVATSGVLMLLIGLALQENAGGQPEPPRPAFDETRCDQPGAATGHIVCRADCPDPFSPEMPATTERERKARTDLRERSCANKSQEDR